MKRLEELAAARGLGLGFARAMAEVLEALAEDPASLSSVTEPREAVRVHVEDSLEGRVVPAVREASRLADIGSGAGFPALVLAAAQPGTQVVAVESVGRKCAFIDRAAALAGLRNVEVVNGRAEDWREGIETCDVVTARALAPLEVLVEYAAPLLVPGGSLVAWKGVRDTAEETAGDVAAGIVGLELTDVLPLPARPGADARHLHVYSKVSPTPDRFPRRAGMARKKPLGASSRG